MAGQRGKSGKKDKPDRGEQALPSEFAHIERIARAKKVHRRLLFSKPNVIGFDVGYRVKNGEVTDERVLKVYVSQKLETEELAKEELLPATVEVDGEEIALDVEEATIPEPQLFTLRGRPLRGGSSVGAVGGGTGTLGICVTLNDGNTYILSCNHVFGTDAGFAAGADILQPSPGDAGVALTDTVADLFSSVALDFGTTTFNFLGVTIQVPNRNFVDAALARARDRFNVGNREIHWIGYPSLQPGFAWDVFKRLSLLGRRVCKMGRTTEFTVGTITSIAWDGFVGPYANGRNAWFEDQIRITGEGPFAGRFSARGDSGSLIVDFATGEPLGLLFASGTTANPINQVMTRLTIPQV